MIYQFLRVALCAALLIGNGANAVGKRALWNFVEAKKDLQKKLAELRKLDSTADVTKSESLVTEIQKHIDDVKKLDPTKAAEFQEVLDASFEQEIAALSIEAGEAKKAVKAEIEEQANTVKVETERIIETVQSSKDPEIKKAALNNLLGYMAFVTVPVSWTVSKFTPLINKSYKMSLRLLDFITRGNVETIHTTYLGILEQERNAFEANIVNTSLIAALKINGFLNRVANLDDTAKATTQLKPEEKRWFLGEMYDQVRGTATAQRTPETFSGSQLHRIVIGELLEYGALLTPIVDLSKHETLGQALAEMGHLIAEIVDQISTKIKVNELSKDEINLFCSIHELYYTLISANDESKKILDPATKKALYSEGKLEPYYKFTQTNIKNVLRWVGEKLNIDPKSLVDSRSYAMQMKDAIAKQGSKITAYTEDFAPIAGLALTIAGGSYLVENYFPDKFKNRYTKYVVASMNAVISKVGAHVSNASDATRAALAAIWSKIPQLPYTDRIKGAVSKYYVKATGYMASGVTLIGGLVAKVRGKTGEVATMQKQENEAESQRVSAHFQDDSNALAAFTTGTGEGTPNVTQERQIVHELYEQTDDAFFEISGVTPVDLPV
jgi:hypothetical protein